MVASVILLWAAAFPLMGSPGPATVSLAGIGSGFGFRAGLPYLAGIILGTFGVLLMIATGVTALVLTMPTLVSVLTIVAAAYILYLAWKILTAPAGAATTDSQPAPSFISGFILAIANPKAFAAIGAVYSGHTLINNQLLSDSVTKILALTLVIVVVNTAWLAFGASFTRVLTDPKLGKIANILFALLLVASVLSVGIQR